MNGKTKSILLQVALKEASASLSVQGIFAMQELEDRTIQIYESLISMHNKLGIEPDEGGARGGNNNRGFIPRAANTNAATTAKEEQGVGFFSEDNEVWRDYRTAITEGRVPEKHPAFKGPNGNKDSVWETNLDGDPDPRFGPLQVAADAQQKATV
jgi:hypothetical protein